MTIMVRSNTTSRHNRSLGDRLISQAVKSPLLYRSALLLVVAALIYLANEVSRLQQHSHHANALRAAIAPHRCKDHDDAPESVPSECHCTDPLKPQMRAGDWQDHHKNLVKLARSAPSDLDVVFIGDSITERLGGTKRTGTIQAPEYKAVFDTYFSKARGAKYEGLALGSSGDITSELLWHMNEGMLLESLQPKVWIVLIGTNDMGRNGCSKRTTLAGILNVLNALRKQKPGAKILVHGLLPRSDTVGMHPQLDFSLGHLYDRILWVNQEIKKLCSLHKWNYMEVNDIFLEKNAKGEEEIISNLMDDALHPTVEGYSKWAPIIVEQLDDILGHR